MEDAQRGRSFVTVLRFTRGDLGERAAFLRAFLRDPFTTGAIAPSSGALARQMIAGIDLAAARTVVEVGPGTGAFTSTILEACGAETRVLAVELNREFAARLERRHPRLRVLHDSVEHLPGWLAALGCEPADVVLCGVPWAILDTATQRRLFRGIYSSLGCGGRFVTFSYVHCAPLPWSRRFQGLLAQSFTEVEASPVVWRNLPPAVVYRCRKGRAGRSSTGS